MVFMQLIDSGVGPESDAFLDYIRYSYDDVEDGFTILSYAIYRNRTELVKPILAHIYDMCGSYVSPELHVHPVHGTILDMALKWMNEDTLAAILSPDTFSNYDLHMTKITYKRINREFVTGSRVMDNMNYIIYKNPGKVSGGMHFKACAYMCNRFCDLVLYNKIDYTLDDAQN